MCLFDLWDSLSQTSSKKPPDLTSTVSAENVFDIPELLGNILSHLEPEDLLTSKQLVNRTWKAAIENTPGVKIKLWTKLNQPYVAWPFAITDWDIRQKWEGSDGTEVRTLNGGVPMFTGVFEINMLAPPSGTMRRELLKKLADDMADNACSANPTPPLSPFARLLSPYRRNAFPRAPILIKPNIMQTSIEPTPLGPLVNIGMEILRSACRGYVVDYNGTRSPAPQYPWLRMFVTDPPAAIAWVSLVMTCIDAEGAPRHARVPCSVRAAGGVTFADVCEAAGKIALCDARPHEEVSIMTYDVRVCFVADGIRVDGEEVLSQTKWV